MNQILDAVQTTYELQQEVNSYLGGISVRSPRTPAWFLNFGRNRAPSWLTSRPGYHRAP